MAQHSKIIIGTQAKAIFIGRLDEDTGIAAYRRLAKLRHIKLVEYTNTPDAAKFLPLFDYAFVSRYLTILEALKAGIAVFAHYNNPIKYDYLTLTPFVKYIHIFSDPLIVNLKIDSEEISQGQKWARTQTWSKLAKVYERLWQK